MSSDANNLRLGDCYVAAWAEVDFRIAQRQNALQIYVTLASGLIAVMFTGHALDVSGLGPQWFSVLLPAVSLSFCALNYKHEQTIGLLRNYLAACEALTPVHGYHTRGPYYAAAQRIRRYHDVAAAFFVALFNVLGFSVARSTFKAGFEWDKWPFFVYILATLAAIVWILTASTTNAPQGTTAK